MATTRTARAAIAAALISTLVLNAAAVPQRQAAATTPAATSLAAGVVASNPDRVDAAERRTLHTDRAARPEPTTVAPAVASTTTTSLSRHATATRAHQARKRAATTRTAAARRPRYALPALPSSARAATVVAFARSQLGDPYRWGATGPNSWDCSGLVQGAERAAGVSVPHYSGAIAATGSRVPAGQWQAGDVIVMPGHVAVYVGAGLMIEAPHTGANVRIAHVRGGYAVRF